MKNQFKTIKPLIGYLILFESLVQAYEVKYPTLVLPAFIIFLYLTGTFKRQKESNKTQDEVNSKQFIARTIQKTFVFVRWSIIIGMVSGIFYAIVFREIHKIHRGKIDKNEIAIHEVENNYISTFDVAGYNVDYGKYNVYFPEARPPDGVYYEGGYTSLEYEVERIEFAIKDFYREIVRDTFEDVLFPTMTSVFSLLCLFGIAIFFTNWLNANK